MKPIVQKIKQFIKFLYKIYNKININYFCIILFEIFQIIFVLIPFFKAELQIWDSLGHLNLANLTDLNDGLYSWDSHYWGGWIKGMYYPMLFHYLLKLCSFIIPIEIAYKIILSIISLLIPVLIYKLLNLFIKNHIHKTIILFLTTLIYFISPGNFFGGLVGTFKGGGAPALIGFFLILILFIVNFKFLLNKNSNKLIYIILIGLLTGILLLTHLLSFTVMCIFYFVILIFLISNKHLITLKYYFYAFLIFLSISISWLIPFFSFQNYILKSSIPGNIELYNLFLLVVLGLITIYNF